MSEQTRSAEEVKTTRWYDKTGGILWDSRPMTEAEYAQTVATEKFLRSVRGDVPVDMPRRDKTAHEVLDEMIALLRRRADQLDRLKGSLPAEMPDLAHQAIRGLVREAMRNI